MIYLCYILYLSYKKTHQRIFYINVPYIKLYLVQVKFFLINFKVL